MGMNFMLEAEEIRNEKRICDELNQFTTLYLPLVYMAVAL